MKPFPRFTPTPAESTSDVDAGSHDPYLPHPRHLHGWSQLSARVHLGRGLWRKGRISHMGRPRPQAR